MILHVRTTNISPVKETAILVVNGPAPLLLYQSPPILENLCISFNISSCLSKFHGQMAASLRSTCCRFHFFYFLIDFQWKLFGTDLATVCYIDMRFDHIVAPTTSSQVEKSVSTTLPETDPHIFYTGGAQVTRTEGHVTSSHQRPHFSLLSIFFVCVPSHFIDKSSPLTAANKYLDTLFLCFGHLKGVGGHVTCFEATWGDGSQVDTFMCHGSRVAPNLYGSLVEPPGEVPAVCVVIEATSSHTHFLGVSDKKNGEIMFI